MQIKCPHCGRVLNVPDGAQAAQGKCPQCHKLVDLSQAERVGLSVGDVVGDFRVDAFIGRGGMAAVYRGTQLSLDRPVAIKVLAPQLARRKQFVERFQREAKVLAQLNHQNIVGVLAVGSASEETYFLAMEFVEGESLRARLARQGRLPFQEAAQIVDAVAAGLEYAHGRGVLHRDIKPANILITSDGVPKIADFGIARLVGRDSAVQQRLTMAQTQMGSAHYMAPEQMKDAATVDHRADLYALGVMFYEMLTGELPIGQFRPASKVPGVPLAADRLVRQALAPDPQDRFDSVAQFRALLQRAMVSGAPTQMGPARAHPPPRRRSSAVPLLVGAAAVAVAGLLVAWFVLRDGGDRQQAVQPPPAKKDTVEKKAPPPQKDPREQQAAELHSLALRRLTLGRPMTAQRHLERLDQHFADTAYYAEHRADIEKLRRDLAARLGTPEPPEKKAPPQPPDKKAPPEPPEKGAPPPPPEKTAGGWVSLFDGETLEGWEPEGGTWSVEDGQVAVAVGASDATLTFKRQTVDDFEFEAEAMNLPGSSGIRFGLLFRRSGPRYQTFCLNATFKALQFYAGGVWRGTINGLSVSPVARERTPFEPGQWYTLRVKCQGERFECYLDDQLVATGTDKALGQGHVGLAVHRSRVRFRNIRLRELPDEAEAPPVAEPEVKPAEVYRNGFAALKPLWQKREHAQALAKAKEIAAKGLEGVAQPPSAVLEQAAAALVEDAEALAAFWDAVETGAGQLKPGEAFRVRGMLGAVTKVEAGRIHLKVGGAEFARKLVELSDGELIALARKARPLTTGPDRLALALLELCAEKPDADAAQAALARAAEAGVETALRETLLKPEAPEPTPREPAEPKAGEWHSLFDGKTLEGWRTLDDRGTWKVEDGAIVGQGRYTRIATEQALEPPYTLRLEAMTARGTGFASALLFGVRQEAGQASPTAYQVLLYDVRGHALNLVRSTLGPPGPPPQLVCKPEEGRFEGGVSHRILLAVGNTGVALAVDGRPVYRVRLEEPPAGAVGLQARDGTRFRNIQWAAGVPKWPAGEEREKAERDLKLGEWHPLCDGKTSKGWTPAKGGFFRDTGRVEVADGCFVLDAAGDYAVGMVLSLPVPKDNYEVAYEMQRVHGGGNSGSLVFPVGEEHCLWGLGNVGRSVGLDGVDGHGDLKEANPTRRFMGLANGQWHTCRLRVTSRRIEAWVDEEQVVDIERRGHTFAVWSGYRGARPFGFVTARGTRTLVRGIRLRRVAER